MDARIATATVIRMHRDGELMSWSEAQKSDVEIIRYVRANYDADDFIGPQTDEERAMLIVLDARNDAEIADYIAGNPLPAFNVDDVENEEHNWAALSLCVFDIATRRCVYCGHVNIWDTYDEYVSDFYLNEWEGEPYHAPSDEGDFDRSCSLCLATREEVADDSPIAAPRDWNDASKSIVATYASDAAPGYALNVEDVDSGTYRPYSRVGN